MADQHDPPPNGEGMPAEPKRGRKPYVKPCIHETEPLENVTLLSGGVNPTTANPFVQ